MHARLRLHCWLFALVPVAALGTAAAQAPPGSSWGTAPTASASAAATVAPPPATGGAVTVGGSIGGAVAPPAAPPPPVAPPPAVTAAPPPGAAPPAPPTKPASPPEEREDRDDTPLFTGTGRFADPYYEVGVTGGSGGLLYAGSTKTPTLTGLRVFEHHGYIARAFMGLLVALGQSNSRYVGSTYHSDGRYVYRTDYYRGLTPAERAAQAKALSDAVSGKYSAEFTYYAPNLLGLDPTGSRSRGFEASIGGDIALGSGGGGLPAVLTVGAYGAYISGTPELRAPTAGNTKASVDYTNFGLLLRLHYPIVKAVDLSLEWDANILTLFKEPNPNARWTSPLKAGAYVNLTDRVYLRGQGILGGVGVSGGKLGAQGELGFRF